MTATLTQFPMFHAEYDGKPLSAGRVFTYESGTFNFLATYQDEAQTILNTNPVILDAQGNATIRLQEDKAYTIEVRDSNGALISSTDDVRASVTSSVASGYVKKTGGAQTVSSEITFSASPQVPSPTNDADAANKAFVLGSVSQGVRGNTKGLQIEYSGTVSTFTAVANSVTLKNAADGYKTVRNVSLTLNTATTGANGLDAGTVAASTWYYVYVIWNETTVAGLISTNSSSPTLPTGYTYSARIGAFYTDATNKYPLRGIQKQSRFHYRVAAGSNVTSLPLIVSGAVGNVTTPTYVATSLTAFVPATAAMLIAMPLVNNNDILVAPSTGYGGRLSTTNPPPVSLASPYLQTQVIDLMLESTDIYVASNGGGLFCQGWIDT